MLRDVRPALVFHLIACLASCANRGDASRDARPEINDDAGVSAAAESLIAAHHPRAPICHVLSPRRFERTRGASDRFEVAFPLTNTGGGPFRLRVRNGDPHTGRHRVSSATIALNGVDLIGPRDLGERVGDLQRDVTLSRENVLKVVLASAPGSHLTVEIEDADRDPPALSATQPAPDALLASQPIDVRGVVNDPRASVSVNGVPARVSDGAFVATPVALEEGLNRLTAIARDVCGNETSTSFSVQLDTVSPDLVASAGLVCSGVVDVSGSVRDDHGPVSVVVEGAISAAPLVVDASGNFSASIAVGVGATAITLIASDAARNETRRSLTLAPVACTALDQCHLPGVCDPATRQCSSPLADDGSHCTDGDPCTQTDSCQAGACVGADAVVCLASDQCHLPGQCDSATGRCSQPVKSCNDDQPCTFDACDPAEGCVNLHAYGPACPTPAPPDDVDIVDFQLMGADFRRNQHVNVSVTLTAAADHPDYRLELVLFPEELSAAGVQVDGSHLGAWHLPMVKQGTSAYETELVIPEDLLPGRYELRAHIYPDGQFEVSSSHPEAYLITDDPGLPVIDVTDLFVEQQAIIIDGENAVDPAAPTAQIPTPLSATVEVVARNHPANSALLTAYAQVPSAGNDPIGLLIWDDRQNRFVAALRLDSLPADAAQSFLLDLALSQPDAQKLRAGMSPGVPVAAKVSVAVNQDGAIAEARCDTESADGPTCRHAIEAEASVFVPSADEGGDAPPAEAEASRAGAEATLALAPAALSFDPSDPVTPPNTKALIYDRNYVKFPHSAIFGAGVRFSGRTSFTRAGFDGNVSAAFRYKLLSVSDEFIATRVTSQAHWGQPAFVDYKVDVLGFTAFEKRETDVSLHVPLDVPLMIKDTPVLKATFIVWIIPVTVSLGGRGIVYVDGAIDARAGTSGADLGITGGPVANLTASAQAAVGFTAFGWGLEAGIRGNVSLIRGDLTAHAGGHLDVIAGADGRPELLKGSLYQKLSYDLSFLSGNLTYFYTYPTIRFCKVLGLSIIPCGFKLARKEKSFQSWPGSHLGPFDVFNKNDPAFELSLACWPLGCGPDPDPDPGPICGNNDCDGTEDCNSCEADCGVCDYSVQEFPVPGPPRFPLDITKGPDGNLWFTYYHGSDIGRITPWGDTTQFRSPCPSPGGITTGPDGNLWYTCAGGIGRMTPTGATTTFTLPSSPGPVFGTPGHSIAVGADGNLWFPINYQAGEPNSVLRIGGKIGRITPDGVITEFPLPFAFSSESILQSGITPGPDGNLWYTRYGSSANRIGRVDLTGRVTEFRIPNGTDAAGITTGPDGNLWFVGGSVNRATPSGVITQFPLSTPSSFAYGITSGPDGNLWFTENRTNRIGRITPAGVMREISVPTPGANPNGITVGPDGAIWFIESNANKIGRLSW